MEKSRAIELLEHLAWDRDIDRNPCGDALRMAIDALKAQHSSEGITKDTTSDTISRTEVVEHLRRMLESTVPNTDYDEGFVDGVEFGVSTVSTMPTIQPQSTTGQLNDGARSTAQSTDLIDRRAVLDAIVQCTNCGDEDTLRGYVLKHNLDNGWTGGILEALDAVKDLPSVQPERKKGEWLPDNNNAYEMRFVCSCCKESEVVPTIGFTKYKPLWDFCPNCGADMRGEKDG